MGGNEWINGYLEAILDTGAGIDEHSKVAPEGNRDLVGFNASRYFVEEVVKGFDETDIHRTWVKATATRNVKERSARLENLCWRIWHLTRKKKQNEAEDAQRVSERQLQREQGRKDSAEDMAEEFLEGERVDAAIVVSPKGESAHASAMPRISSDLEGLNDDDQQKEKEKKLYIVLISLHGLVRGENMELGRDSDTGGQVKYVVEFARALAMMPEVYRVDLLTRQISARDVDWSYGEPTEMLTAYDCESHEVGESSGAYIVRIPCGPRDKYLPKELLWPYIQEFVDGALAHILNMAKVLGDQLSGGDPLWPYVIHGHYADAGDISSLLSGALNVPMVLTGHSLGRNKLEQLLKQGRQSKEDINATYRIMRRIEAEELSLDAAELVITSTRQEIIEQWGLYDGFNVNLERVLRARAKRGVSCHGRYMPRMVVIPPGMDFSNVIVQDAGDVSDVDGDVSDFSSVIPTSPRPNPPMWTEIMRFFTNPHKPMILALARPDPKKNITTLLKAFGECRPLRDLANLTLIMGNRNDIDDMSNASANVLTAVLKLIDKYDLYGQVAYPKHHKQSDVPDIYRLAAKTKGVFINPALVEPFGLTLIEAAAHGLPMVATKNGGPVDIASTLHNGLLVDPHDDKEIADALLKLLAERNLWIDCRKNGLKNIHLYSWPQHCKNYLSRVALCRMRHPQWQNDADGNVDLESFGDSLRDVHDMSLRLSDDGERSGSLNSSLEKILRGCSKNVEQLRQAFEKHMQGVREEDAARVGTNNEKVSQSNGNALNKIQLLRKRKRLFVIAVDAYDIADASPEGMIKAINEIFKAGKADGLSTGYILSSALTAAETLNMLSSGGVDVHEFDALICSSGSELFYPGGSQSTDDGAVNQADAQLTADSDYLSHIEYRWGGEALRKAMQRLSVSFGGERVIVEDVSRCHSHCLSYKVNTSSAVPKVDELRPCLRMRGLRCHAVYTHNGTKLHILPLFASRSQALRYLFVRWGVDVANMFVFIGESGDTDYEQLLGGTHKVIVLKGIVEGTSETLLRSNSSYTTQDVAPSPSESPFLVSVSVYNDDDNGSHSHSHSHSDSQSILNALNKFSS